MKTTSALRDGKTISRRQLLSGLVPRAKTMAAPPIAIIAPDCLAFNNIACRNCDDACAERAIRFRPQVGGHYAPSINESACTACGDCVALCPVSAISIAGVDDRV